MLVYYLYLYLYYIIFILLLLKNRKGESCPHSTPSWWSHEASPPARLQFLKTPFRPHPSITRRRSEYPRPSSALHSIRLPVERRPRPRSAYRPSTWLRSPAFGRAARGEPSARLRGTASGVRPEIHPSALPCSHLWHPHGERRPPGDPVLSMSYGRSTSILVPGLPPRTQFLFAPSHQKGGGSSLWPPSDWWLNHAGPSSLWPPFDWCRRCHDTAFPHGRFWGTAGRPSSSAAIVEAATMTASWSNVLTRQTLATAAPPSGAPLLMSSGTGSCKRTLISSFLPGILLLNSYRMREVSSYTTL